MSSVVIPNLAEDVQHFLDYDPIDYGDFTPTDEQPPPLDDIEELANGTLDVDINFVGEEGRTEFRTHVNWATGKNYNWDWAQEQEVTIPWSISYTCDGPIDPPCGHTAGKVWLRDHFGFMRDPSYGYLSDIAPEYTEALKDAATVQDDLPHARLTWEGSDNVLEEFDDEAWCKLQVFRVKCSTAPLPTFTGVQLEA
ncbi:hypothetical protein VKT23_011941 [Stygiomarasmius scandens]|uniref:Uncharacterized protein n=1 Tax=Marasmiellus scandens TaxID=2682957 RepID=A0ABR1J7W4_9AGAR